VLRPRWDLSLPKLGLEPREISDKRRDELKAHLDANGIGNAVHYPMPLHLQKAYASLGHKPGDFSIAEKASREGLSVPMYAGLTDEQIQRVAQVVKDFFRS